MAATTTHSEYATEMYHFFVHLVAKKGMQEARAQIERTAALSTAFTAEEVFAIWDEETGKNYILEVPANWRG